MDSEHLTSVFCLTPEGCLQVFSIQADIGCVFSKIILGIHKIPSSPIFFKTIMKGCWILTNACIFKSIYVVSGCHME